MGNNKTELIDTAIKIKIKNKKKRKIIIKNKKRKGNRKKKFGGKLNQKNNKTLAPLVFHVVSNQLC